MKSIEDEKVAQSSQGAENRAIPKSVTQSGAHGAQKSKWGTKWGTKWGASKNLTSFSQIVDSSQVT